MAVMGKNSNEITTLHLVKTYCLPRCYSAVKSGISPTEVCISSTWHGIIVSDTYFEVSGEKV